MTLEAEKSPTAPAIPAQPPLKLPVPAAGPQGPSSASLPAAVEPTRGPSPRPSGPTPLRDLAFLLTAVLIVAGPALLSDRGGDDPRVETLAVEPLRIDINRAPWYEWTLLEGIGEARARAIVGYREANGPFASIEDLRRIPRLPAGWVDRARPLLELRAP
jgi:competence protein ComEA